MIRAGIILAFTLRLSLLYGVHAEPASDIHRPQCLTLYPLSSIRCSRKSGQLLYISTPHPLTRSPLLRGGNSVIDRDPYSRSVSFSLPTLAISLDRLMTTVFPMGAMAMAIPARETNKMALSLRTRGSSLALGDSISDLIGRLVYRGWHQPTFAAIKWPCVGRRRYERTPQGRMGNVDELNGTALYLAS